VVLIGCAIFSRGLRGRLSSLSKHGFVGFQNRLVFFSSGFGKNTNHPFSAGVLVRIKFLGFGKKQSHG
jgi:hypothetical protein